MDIFLREYQVPRSDDSLEKKMDIYLQKPQSLQKPSLTELEEQKIPLNENEEEKIENSHDIISIKKNMNFQKPTMINLYPLEVSTNSQTNEKKFIDIKKAINPKNFRLDNTLNSAGSSCLGSIYFLLHERCKAYDFKLKRPNFENLFSKNILYHQQFISLKIKQIFIYQLPENKEVIRKMIEEKKDDVFEFIVDCTFEFIYKKYLGNINKNEENDEHIIPIDENNDDFNTQIWIDKNIQIKTLNDIIKEKKDKMKKPSKKKKQLTEQEIEMKINYFKEISINFIKIVKGEGKLKKRNPKQPDFKFE